MNSNKTPEGDIEGIQLSHPLLTTSINTVSHDLLGALTIDRTQIYKDIKTKNKGNYYAPVIGTFIRYSSDCVRLCKNLGELGDKALLYVNENSLSKASKEELMQFLQAESIDQIRFVVANDKDLVHIINEKFSQSEKIQLLLSVMRRSHNLYETLGWYGHLGGANIEFLLHLFYPGILKQKKIYDIMIECLSLSQGGEEMVHNYLSQTLK